MAILEPTPLRFVPLLKRTIWGGRRLGTMLHRPIGPHDDYAESWEIVDHGADQSVVADDPIASVPVASVPVASVSAASGSAASVSAASGSAAGRTLSHLFAEHREWLMGESWVHQTPSPPSFPLLFKFLDCNRVLSVQVHPDDAYGATMRPPDLGKTEAWVILHSDPDSVIYAGLKSGVDRERLAAAIAAGRTEDALHSFHPERGDCVFIPAGTVHALGGGLVVAEIQQSSNTTFRLFDWNRTDASGKSRPLHIEESLAVTDYRRGPVNPIRPSLAPPNSLQRLVQCDKFTLEQVECLGPAKIALGGDDRCRLIACIEGVGVLSFAGGDMRLGIGDCVLVPAASAGIELGADESSQKGSSGGRFLVMVP